MVEYRKVKQEECRDSECQLQNVHSDILRRLIHRTIARGLCGCSQSL